MKRRFSNERIFLLFLLLVLSILIRLLPEHQATFDSYRMHGMADSISTYGYANWVLHPASLFGYYPLSQPSGLQYLLSSLSTLMGTSMDYTILFFSVFIGVFSVFTLFVLVYRFKNFNTAYLTASIFSFSPHFLYFTAWNASARVMIVFVAIFMLLLINIILTQKKTLLRVKYALVSLFALVYGFLFHRSAQLLFIIVMAFILTFLYRHLHVAYNYVQHKKPIKFLKKRYSTSLNLLVLDLAIIVFVLAIFKIIDLVSRGRLWINVERRLVRFQAFYDTLLTLEHTILLFAGISLGVLLLVGIITLYLKRKTVFPKIIKTWDKLLIFCTKNHEKALSIFLLIVATYLFIAQFFGKSFYSPSLSEYYTSRYLSGEQPYIVFANFVINYFTTMSIFIPFLLLGFHYFIFKKKTSFEFLIVVVAVGISGILLDKRYVRLFVIPFMSILVGTGLIIAMNWLSKKMHVKIKNFMLGFSICFILLSLIFGAYFPIVKEQVFGNDNFINVKKFESAGEYIGDLDGEFSTITTGELFAGIVIFAESGVPGAAHNVYYYANRSYLETEKIGFEEIKKRFTQGKKITDLWELEDWILGGDYYTGRHALMVFKNDFNEPKVRRAIEDYNERYYIHDKTLETNAYFDSITGVKNKVYDNPIITIHDMHLGRVQ